LSRLRVVLGLPDMSVRVWEYIPSASVMVSAALWRWGRPPVSCLWMDSGGYQALVRGLSIDVEYVAKRYRELEPEVCMALDEPPTVPFTGDRGVVEKNLRLFEELWSRAECCKLVPVIHPYAPNLVEEAVELYRGYGVDTIAIGGLVPLIMGRRGRLCRVMALVFLVWLRRLLRERIHILGMGGACTTMGIMAMIGVDSLDSSSWRVKAAYGKILVPGRGERYVGDGRARFGRKDLSPEEFEELRRFLEATGFPLTSSLESLLKTFQGRAIVNAWVVTHYVPRPTSRTRLWWMARLVELLEPLGVDELRYVLDELMEERLNSEAPTKLLHRIIKSVSAELSGAPSISID